MGLELRLLPVGGIKEVISSPNNFFNCDKDYHLFEQIDQIIALPVSPNFEVFFDTEECWDYGSLTSDGYGGQLTYVLVKDLLKCNPHPESQTNRAVWAYLKQLPLEGKIALYWH